MKHLLRVSALFLLCLPLTAIGCGSSTATPPSVVTNDATGMTANSAMLNGELTALGTVISADVGFNWGTTSGSYSNATSRMPIWSTGAFSVNIIDLTPGTTYYFRAVAEGDGRAFGVERSFTTLP